MTTPLKRLTYIGILILFFLSSSKNDSRTPIVTPAGMFEKNLKPKRPKLKANELPFAIREPFKSVSDFQRQYRV